MSKSRTRANRRRGGVPAPKPARPKQSLREKISSHEKPGTITKGPPITVACDCGSSRKLTYGEQWTCEACGKTWDTGDIPNEQYALIRRTQLRFRVLPVVLGMALAAVAVFFLVTGNAFSVMFLLPLALMTWFVLLRPGHRRRYREAISDLPKWKLHPHEQ